MPQTLNPSTDERTMICPTCGAQQEPADQCRRCRCDLSLLQAAWRTGHHHRSTCLRALRMEHFSQALQHARLYEEVFPGQDASRLIAVCNLLAGNWHDAIAWSRQPGQP